MARMNISYLLFTMNVRASLSWSRLGKSKVPVTHFTDKMFILKAELLTA